MQQKELNKKREKILAWAYEIDRQRKQWGCE